MQSFTASKCILAPVIISGHYIFSESACIFSKRFYICKALLLFFKALSYLQSAFIIFQSAFISAKRFYYFSALALISGCKGHNFLIMLLIIFDILNMFQY
jgi:hypothetical protein